MIRVRQKLQGFDDKIRNYLKIDELEGKCKKIIAKNVAGVCKGRLLKKLQLSGVI